MRKTIEEKQARITRTSLSRSRRDCLTYQRMITEEDLESEDGITRGESSHQSRQNEKPEAESSEEDSEP